jgi:hypothetical protein
MFTMETILLLTGIAVGGAGVCTLFRAMQFLKNFSNTK